MMEEEDIQSRLPFLNFRVIRTDAQTTHFFNVFISISQNIPRDVVGGEFVNKYLVSFLRVPVDKSNKNIDSEITIKADKPQKANFVSTNYLNLISKYETNYRHRVKENRTPAQRTRQCYNRLRC
ncbi:hypothetical protein RF11_12137 [Thelohanellus kitauei]|uniref:Uncharacterized protein n=1 Tax=Thelohanellus kitauei TaxID=669202 RepID=A0A0C2J1D0_THEKT|nr:hypothetical protein RF11_12137 [Thelohanellus kitauei]